jgi:hypothetical protein
MMQGGVTTFRETATVDADEVAGYCVPELILKGNQKWEMVGLLSADNRNPCGFNAVNIGNKVTSPAPRIPVLNHNISEMESIFAALQAPYAHITKKLMAKVPGRNR